MKWHGANGLPKESGTRRLRGRAGQAQRDRRLERTGRLCEDCMAAGRVSVATAVDHIIPLAHGGPDTDDNTRNLCDQCHRKRTAARCCLRWRAISCSRPSSRDDAQASAPEGSAYLKP